MSKNTSVLPRRWVELYVDESEESSEALELLDKEGYSLITFPVQGKFGPELRVDTDEGKKVYLGLSEIRGFVQRMKQVND